MILSSIKPLAILESKVNEREIISLIERAGRTAYKSENKITRDSAREFVRKIIRLGHESVLEHATVSVRVICDRAIANEIVRHRIASYTQESSRYCDLNNKMEIILPENITQEEESIITGAAMKSMQAYKQLRDLKNPPQIARAVLPLCLKTEIVITMNLRAWRHFFKLRCAPAAHPQMRQVANRILELFKSKIPIIVEDIK